MLGYKINYVCMYMCVTCALHLLSDEDSNKFITTNHLSTDRNPLPISLSDVS